MFKGWASGFWVSLDISNWPLTQPLRCQTDYPQVRYVAVQRQISLASGLATDDSLNANFAT